MATMPGAEIVQALLEVNDGTLYAGTYPNGRVFKSTDDGATWSDIGELAGATKVQSLMAASDGTLFAGTGDEFGDVFRIDYPGPCPDPPVRIPDTPPLFYSTYQNAYDDSIDMDIIQGLAAVHAGDLFIDINKSITLESGFNCGFTTSTGETRLYGDVIISNGTVTFE